MGLKFLLLLRFGLINIVAFALLGAAWAQGLVAKVINIEEELIKLTVDPLPFVPAICITKGNFK